MKQQDKEKPREPKKTKREDIESEKLRQQIDDLQTERDEVFEKLQRVSADYTNFQKRVPKQITDTIFYEKEKIIKTLLPALDNFEHTLQNARSAENVETIVKGVQIIYDQMLDILKSHGVEQIEALGEKFDPALHEAMMQKTEPQEEEGIVLEEFQKGYKLNGRVIRPTKAIVNKLPSEEAAQQQQPQEEKVDPQEPVDEYEAMDTE
jgi:molecular chaperone GrpE